MGGQVAEQHRADIGLDIMLNAVAVVGEVGSPPMVETVKLHIFIQKLAECDELLCDKLFFAGRLDGRAQCTDRLRIFNLSNTRVRFLIGAKAFRDSEIFLE